MTRVKLEEVLRLVTGRVLCVVQVGAALTADVAASSYDTDKIDQIIAAFGEQTITSIGYDSDDGLLIQARKP